MNDVRGVCVIERQEKGLLMYGSSNYQVKIVSLAQAAPRVLMPRDHSHSLGGLVKCAEKLAVDWAEDSSWSIVTDRDWHGDIVPSAAGVSRLSAIPAQEVDEAGWDMQMTPMRQTEVMVKMMSEPMNAVHKKVD